MTRRPFRSYLAAILCAILLTATTTFACGPFTLDAIFTFTVHPAYPLENFARGQIGVVQPSYARSYLYVAYRYLHGLKFDPQEQKALTELWKSRLDLQGSADDQEWIKSWLEARQRVPGLAEPPKIEVYRNREKPNEYESFVNCNKESFATAAATLNARIAKFGPESPIVKEWIAAQDQVFANCSEGRHLPEQAAADADALVRADRAYQIAAANFYATNFDEAKAGFARITSDGSSPWQQLAPYLVARTLVRKASLGPPESKTDLLSQAESQLQQILADNKLSSSHAAAGKLMDLVRLRLHPHERTGELAKSLLAPAPNSALKQQLWDYTILLDGVLDVEDTQAKVKPETMRGDDLTDWIYTFQSDSPEARDHALAQWQATQSNAWLVAALSKATGKDAKSSELVSAARQIKPDSAAFPSASFHAVRLLIEGQQLNEARSLVNDLLKNNRSQFDPSSLNLLLSQRMSLAGNLSDLLAYSFRVPAGLSWNDDGREVPAEAAEIGDESKAMIGKALFDEDAGAVLNQKLPLSLLQEAAKNPTLPAHLRRDVAQATWLRAVLLDNDKVADEVTPTLKTLLPEFSELLNDFTATTQPDAKKFSGIYAWLKFPGLEPVVDVGIGRQTALNQQDTYRDNWWCGAAFPTNPEKKEDSGAKSFTAAGAKHNPGFLTPAEVAAANKEKQQLESLGAAPNYLCQQVIQWATKTPNDPRVPEALHLAVNTTRYGCTDKQTGRWSKAAYDLLHRQYPNSPWTKKTKYWFKD
ncbi:MAG TPA: hypothetical protein VKB46_00900 [Pyrinomonadaceae bacterium]|nr:hypothetical protein [Pyrinomonadaceae bacterium]